MRGAAERLLTTLLLASATLCAPANETVDAAATGSVGEGSFFSASLQAPLEFSYYLPPGFDTGHVYPTLYLLHGYGGTHRDWLRAGQLAATADRLIAHGGLKPLIVIMPAAGNSWYVNTPELGPAGMLADALSEDLVAHVDARWPTIATRAGRALAGLSMGGYGAVRLALAAPQRFVAAASLSGALFSGDAHSPFFNPVFESRVQRRLFGNAFGTPFDIDRYHAANVFASLAPHATTPGSGSATTSIPPAIYLTAGDDDSFGLYRGAMATYVALREAGVPTELRISDGKHSWKLWRRELGPALRFVSSRLAAARQH